MNRAQQDDVGKLLVRWTVGGMMLFHGLHKVFHGVGKIPVWLAERGLPGWFAYGVYVGEVVAPLLICAGLRSRAAALVLAFNMLVAIWLVHGQDVLRRSVSGGWAIELQMFYLLGALAVALFGSGRYSLSRGRGRWD
ncbi:MAG: DoxX family protein [Myxococcales bacterium]|nr:DoxX family protein [Myxococcota bacterium]MDW8280386.1 DoxX family protein [Myxococcales bacterium]